jgi:FKBP-type peptidyl-prolyl cis-trans isomerase
MRSPFGTGARAERGTIVTIHHRGFLHRRDQVRSSYNEERPLRVRLGTREVIAGLQRGLLGMRVSGLRRLVISPRLAYGKSGVPGIVPPNAVLIFDVELLGVQASTTTSWPVRGLSVTEHREAPWNVPVLEHAEMNASAGARIMRRGILQTVGHSGVCESCKGTRLQCTIIGSFALGASGAQGGQDP